MLSDLGATAAWWTCHDEGDLDAMVSLVVVRDGQWKIEPLVFERGGTERTDAEALARAGDTVFVFGSNFTDRSGSFDDRRAFVGRFSESAAVTGSGQPEVLDLGRGLVDLVWSALASVDLLRSDSSDDLVNIEGAGVVGSDLFVGLRWPVTVDGQPLLVRIANGATALSAPHWSAATIESLEASAVVVDVGATRKRPAGVRGLTVVDDAMHLIVGQTDRSLAAKKVKAAGSRHVVVHEISAGRAASSGIEQFEGFRKVEGVAPAPDRRWLYALDDEDAVVLVLSHDP